MTEFTLNINDQDRTKTYISRYKLEAARKMIKEWEEEETYKVEIERDADTFLAKFLEQVKDTPHVRYVVLLIVSRLQKYLVDLDEKDQERRAEVREMELKELRARGAIE